MKSLVLFAGAAGSAIALLLAGCADPARSRDVGNPAVTAQTLARQVCSNCHGVTGNPRSPNFPRLAGQPADYLVGELKAFRDHSRADAVAQQYMWGLTRHLTDQQIDGLAHYYAAQAPAPVVVESSVAAVDLGRRLYQQGEPAQQVIACASCHGSRGEGLAAFPRLAGQPSTYLATQLRVFQQGGERPEGGVMENIARHLSEPQIEDVAAYAATLGTTVSAQAGEAAPLR